MEVLRGGNFMVFSSLQFIFIFLPIFFVMYYLIPYKFKNIVLLIGSLVFYFVGTINNPEHMVVFLASIILDYFVGVLIEKYEKHKKLFLVTGIIFHISSLFIFKYAGFVASEINRYYPSVDLVISLILPIGISFYTFQGISYIVDVYRKKVTAEKSIIRFAVYISMFEQLIAGPIVTYSQVKDNLADRKALLTLTNFFKGVGVFIFGLGLKVLIANPIGKLWTQLEAIGFESISTPLAWMGIIAFSFQIYFDFYGYSLMAVGLGEMLGFTLPKNFDFPYLSRSMTEFWRRWHMTLGNWFREYIYIPLGGNRDGALATVRNLLAVWILTGLWHGAGYNFILWGTVIFLIIFGEKFIYGKVLNKIPVLGHIYMIFLIPLTWALFAIDDAWQLKMFFLRLFPFGEQGVWSVFRHDYLKYLQQYYPFFIAGFLFSTRLPFNILKKIKSKLVIVIILLGILAGSVYCMYNKMDDPFLYFRF